MKIKTKLKNKTAIFVCVLVSYIAVLTLFYWNFPMTYQPDSSTYLQSAGAIVGIYPISQYSAYRGAGISLYLGLFLKLFGVGDFAVRMAFYMMFLLYGCGVAFLFCQLPFFHKKQRIFYGIGFTSLFVFNPIITTYSHLCLTEFFVITFQTLYLGILYACYKKNKKWYFNMAYTALFCVLTYSFKQAAFLLPLITFCALQVLVWFQDRKLKPIGHVFLAILVCMISVLTYIKIWNNFLPQSSVEGESVDSYAASFLVDGLRYFRPSERGVVNQQVRIDVMDDLYENVQDSFEYTFSGGIGDSLNYFLKCATTYPQRVWKGYQNNYSVISGVHNVILGADINNRCHTRVTTTKRFFNGQENEAFLGTFCTIHQEVIQEFETNYFAGQPISFNQEKYYNSLLTKLGLMNIHNRFALFVYSFISYYAFYIFVIATALAVFIKKNPYYQKLCVLIASLGLTVFTFISFLAVTAQNIDRYGIVIYGVNLIIVYCLLALAIEIGVKFILKMYQRVKYKRLMQVK